MIDTINVYAYSGASKVEKSPMTIDIADLIYTVCEDIKESHI